MWTGENRPGGQRPRVNTLEGVCHISKGQGPTFGGISDRGGQVTGNLSV